MLSRSRQGYQHVTLRGTSIGSGEVEGFDFVSIDRACELSTLRSRDKRYFVVIPTPMESRQFTSRSLALFLDDNDLSLGPSCNLLTLLNTMSAPSIKTQELRTYFLTLEQLPHLVRVQRINVTIL